MKRKDYKLFKNEINCLLKQIDLSFESDCTYSKDASIVRDVANLRYVVHCLYNDLIH